MKMGRVVVFSAALLLGLGAATTVDADPWRMQHVHDGSNYVPSCPSGWK